jgi:hypothetical protein
VVTLPFFPWCKPKTSRDDFNVHSHRLDGRGTTSWSIVLTAPCMRVCVPKNSGAKPPLNVYYIWSQDRTQAWNWVSWIGWSIFLNEDGHNLTRKWGHSSTTSFLSYLWPGPLCTILCSWLLGSLGFEVSWSWTLASTQASWTIKEVQINNPSVSLRIKYHVQELQTLDNLPTNATFS